jgi:hypothetical protein
MTGPPIELGRPAVFCACGAQWHGRIVGVAAVTIAIHRKRWGTDNALGCGRISHAEYRGNATRVNAASAPRRAAGRNAQ